MDKYYLVCSVWTVGNYYIKDGIVEVTLSDSENFTVDDIELLKSEFLKQVLRNRKETKICGIINFLNIV